MKVPTRSPTHEDLELRRLSSMGLELEDIADGDAVQLAALVELAEDRGRPPSHYLAAIALATSRAEDSSSGSGRAGGAEESASGDGLRVEPAAAVTVRVCAGICQRYGALDLLDRLVDRWVARKNFAIAPVTCLDRCDQAPACEVHGPHGKLVLAPATAAALDEALDQLASG